MPSSSKIFILHQYPEWKGRVVSIVKQHVTKIVEALSTSYLGPDYSQAKEFGEVSLKDIDQLANSSFPLRMHHLFEKLREEHHLKHGGRMQLGLFLKVFKAVNLCSHKEMKIGALVEKV
ncbi:putative DNA primase large subunit [Acorus calamus]|uniref:DNA primase large subunit n=1 Tax=Acorus calamus TaxID=4465 RepID=A0AAV9D7G8_ACOCL|nr:putative DNA primase large subunit [Acorus calamus]